MSMDKEVSADGIKSLRCNGSWEILICGYMMWVGMSNTQCI